MILRKWLVTLAGGRYDVLEQTPTDRLRYTATGGVLLTTAAVAAVSAAFALRMAVRLPWWAAVIAGVLWGVVILNLDRLLIIGMTRRAGWLRNIVGALPRVALAILLGTVISTPLVLRIFQPEIDTELEALQNERDSRYSAELDANPRYQEIAALEKKLAETQAVADRSSDATVAADPGVIAAEAEVKRARETYETAQRLATCEVDGSCGTGIPGIAEAAQERQRTRDIALADYDSAKSKLDLAQTKAREGSASASASARSEAERLRADVEQRRAARESDRTSFSSRLAEDDGLLSRIEALNSLADKRPRLGLAQFVLFLLFLSLEVLPVLAKLLQLGGPPTTYDQLIARMETDAERTAARNAARERGVADHYLELQAQVEEDQAQRQYEAGLAANRLLVGEQALIAEQAIRRWAAEARRQSDRELTEFFGSSGRPADPRTVQFEPVTRPFRPQEG
ncbi:DUF4407 domain-containing protein [Lentzea sp. JNUCC 0626]|uniref:DUF4407 domain-containing protein n=1 Tax=Lentzea sp. JNUCC 0626 TaxID=3367513 RepID=UPI003748CF6E